jgi:hypothetical protein
MFLKISHFRHKKWPRKNPKKSETRLERSKGLRVFSAAGYPPCPIDRRCGGVAVVMPAAPPNFSAEIERNFSFRPTNRPTFEDGTSTPGPRFEALEIFVMRPAWSASATRSVSALRGQRVQKLALETALRCFRARRKRQKTQARRPFGKNEPIVN